MTVEEYEQGKELPDYLEPQGFDQDDGEQTSHGLHPPPSAL